MITIKMMTGDEFTVSSEDANLLSGQSGLVYLPSLDGMINVSSISYILPTRVKFETRKQDRDGRWCIDKFKQNDWRLENNPEVKVDLSYYPELVNKYDSDLKKISNPQLN